MATSVKRRFTVHDTSKQARNSEIFRVPAIQPGAIISDINSCLAEFDCREARKAHTVQELEGALADAVVRQRAARVAVRAEREYE
jgi:hypothetical protein